MKKILLAVAFVCGTASASTDGNIGLTVLVNEEPRREYAARGTTYIEALRGADYTLRITNPTPYRVAVALSVDGLNTIDAKHTDAWNAAKWVLDPYETTDIAGWQINDRTARRFFFTGEKHSYATALGHTENLGVIEAVVYRERQHRVQVQAPAPPAPEAMRKEAAAGAAPAAPPSDDYAATGMGGRTRHDVESVNIDLERNPIATIRIRYEYRPELVKLGVLRSFEEPLERREHASGFGSYCPEPR